MSVPWRLSTKYKHNKSGKNRWFFFQRGKVFPWPLCQLYNLLPLFSCLTIKSFDSNQAQRPESRCDFLKIYFCSHLPSQRYKYILLVLPLKHILNYLFFFISSTVDVAGPHPVLCLALTNASIFWLYLPSSTWTLL